MATKRVAANPLRAKFETSAEPSPKKSKPAAAASIVGDPGKQDSAKSSLVSQIIRRWNLSDEMTVTTGYTEDDVSVMFGNHQEHLFGKRTSNRVIFMTGNEALAFLDMWNEIAASIDTRATSKITIPREFDPDNFSQTYVMGYGGDGRYSMSIYQTMNTVDISAVNPSLVLSLGSIQKLLRARKFIVEHLKLLMTSGECFNNMKYSIVDTISKLTSIKNLGSVKKASYENICHGIESIISNELKKVVFDDFSVRCRTESVMCQFNVYALFSFTIAQLGILLKIWMETEDVDADDEEEEEDS